MQADASRYKKELLVEQARVAALECSEKTSKQAMDRAQEELQALRARTSAQLNDAVANKGEIWKQMMQAKQEAGNEKRELQDKLSALEADLEAANTRCDVQAREMQMLISDKSTAQTRVWAQAPQAVCIVCSAAFDASPACHQLLPLEVLL